MRKGFFFGSGFLALVVGGALVAYLLAPVRHAITGYVYDANGAAAANATVEITSENAPSANTQRITTNSNGWFAFPGLPQGKYRVVTTLEAGRVEMNDVSPGTRLSIAVGAK